MEPCGEICYFVTGLGGLNSDDSESLSHCVLLTPATRACESELEANIGSNSWIPWSCRNTSGDAVTISML